MSWSKLRKLKKTQNNISRSYKKKSIIKKVMENMVVNKYNRVK